MQLERVMIVPEPYHEYAQGFLEAFHRRHGLRSVVVFSSRRQELEQRRHFPPDARVAARYVADEGNVKAFCDDVRTRFDVVGAVPYAEQTLSFCAQVGNLLGLGWNSVEVLGRFRDKHRMKEFLAQQHPSLPLGQFRRVRSTEEVFSQPLPRSVLKRVDGFGNRGIGFLDGNTTRAEVSRQLAGGGEFVLEERFEGPEYAVNGVVDAAGVPLVLNVARYHRAHVNGIENVYHHQTHVPRRDPAFQPLADYACRVLALSGLRRCPFHLEAFLTTEGPRLVEVAARLPGSLTALQMADLHGFDLCDTLADLYVLPATPVAPAVDWNRYEAWNAFSHDGAATDDDTICSIRGVEAAEQHPDFKRWVFKPTVGARVRRTVDLYTVPFSFQLLGQRTDGEMTRVAEQLAAGIVWNQPARPLARRWMQAVTLGKRLTQRARWEGVSRSRRLPPSGRMVD